MCTDIRNLYLFETIDSALIADKINKALQTKNSDKILNVMVQVNTSGEARKSDSINFNILNISIRILISRKGRHKFGFSDFHLQAYSRKL